MKKKETADNILWQEITANNEKAFSTVFDKYFLLLCNFSHTIVKDSSTAEDIVSEVFVKLWLNRHSIQLTTGLKPYLYRATKNTALNYQRKVNFDLCIDDVNEKELISNKTADSELVENEVFFEIQQLLDTLSPQQGTVLKMHKLEGLSQKEIAEKLSISLKTVQNHIYLALKFLSEKLAARQYDFYLYFIVVSTLFY